MMLQHVTKIHKNLS